MCRSDWILPVTGRLSTRMWFSKDKLDSMKTLEVFRCAIKVTKASTMVIAETTLNEASCWEQIHFLWKLRPIHSAKLARRGSQTEPKADSFVRIAGLGKRDIELCVVGTLTTGNVTSKKKTRLRTNNKKKRSENQFLRNTMVTRALRMMII